MTDFDIEAARRAIAIARDPDHGWTHAAGVAGVGLLEKACDEVERLRAHWRAIAEEVDFAVTHQTKRGMAGSPPQLAMVPMSTLKWLERCARAALAEYEEKT